MCCLINIAFEHVSHHVLRRLNEIWHTDVTLKSCEKQNVPKRQVTSKSNKRGDLWHLWLPRKSSEEGKNFFLCSWTNNKGDQRESKNGCLYSTRTKPVVRWWSFHFAAKALPTKLKANHLRWLWPGSDPAAHLLPVWAESEYHSWPTAGENIQHQTRYFCSYQYHAVLQSSTYIIYNLITYDHYLWKVDLKSKGLFCGHKTSLHHLIKEMGFRYKIVNNKRRYYEQPRIVEQRFNYLQRMRRNRSENRPVVYLDETWCNAHHGKEKAWVERDEVTGGTLGGIKWVCCTLASVT